MPGRFLVVSLCAIFLSTLLACAGDDSRIATPAAGGPTAAAPASSPETTAAREAPPAQLPRIATPGAGPLTETQVIRYEPPSTATRTLTGSCQTPSLEVRRPNAWRCSADGEGDFDPCFGDYTALSLVCVRSPFETAEPVVLALNPPLTISLCTPPGQPARTCTVVAADVPETRTTHIWAFETVDGEFCILKGRGTSAVLNGDRLNYFCRTESDFTTNGFIGEPAPGVVWTARRVQGATELPPESWTTPVPETAVQLRTVWW